jgi:hypothetical protein
MTGLGPWMRIGARMLPTTFSQDLASRNEKFCIGLSVYLPLQHTQCYGSKLRPRHVVSHFVAIADAMIFFVRQQQLIVACTILLLTATLFNLNSNPTVEALIMMSSASAATAKKTAGQFKGALIFLHGLGETQSTGIFSFSFSSKCIYS